MFTWRWQTLGTVTSRLQVSGSEPQLWDTYIGLLWMAILQDFQQCLKRRRPSGGRKVILWEGGLSACAGLGVATAVGGSMAYMPWRRSVNPSRAHTVSTSSISCLFSAYHL